jgi:phospholipid transport system substrate-binding protein
MPNLEKYTGKMFDVVAVERGPDDEFNVETEIRKDGNAPIRVIYKVRLQNGKFMVYDIVAEGVSMITTHRTDFSNVISHKSIDYLVTVLRDKVDNYKQ